MKGSKKGGAGKRGNKLKPARDLYEYEEEQEEQVDVPKVQKRQKYDDDMNSDDDEDALPEDFEVRLALSVDVSLEGTTSAGLSTSGGFWQLGTRTANELNVCTDRMRKLKRMRP